MNNMLKFGTGDLGHFSQLCHDCIRIMSLLINRSSSSIRNFSVGAVEVDVFIKWVIPI